MYSFEETERIAKDTTTRESVKIYLLDKLVDALKAIAENTGTDIQQVEMESLQDSLRSITDGLFDIKETTKELIEIRYALSDIAKGLNRLNQTQADCEDDLTSIFENIGSVGEIIAERGDRHE